jgi:hypothetical protein
MGGASQAIISPVAYVAFALLYYDARVEDEAFDVEVLTRQGTGQDAGSSTAPSAP